MRATARTKGSVKQTTKVTTPTTKSGSGSPPSGSEGGGQRRVAYRMRVPSATSRKHARMETTREVLCDLLRRSERSGSFMGSQVH